jgi:hypothetical protein
VTSKQFCFKINYKKATAPLLLRPPTALTTTNKSKKEDICLDCNYNFETSQLKLKSYNDKNT